MKEIDVTKLSIGDAYKLLIGTIVPRPIAWVSTISAKGQVNLAPFSFFNGVCSNPPSVLFCPVNHPDGSKKDTLRNIQETKQFVINIATEKLALAVNETSGNYPPEINEFEIAKLTPIPSIRVKPPRIKESPIHMECELLQIVPVGTGEFAARERTGSGHIVIGKLVYYHITEGAMNEKGHIFLEKINPIARLGGSFYCPIRDVFELPRPQNKKG